MIKGIKMKALASINCWAILFALLFQIGIMPLQAGAQNNTKTIKTTYDGYNRINLVFSENGFCSSALYYVRGGDNKATYHPSFVIQNKDMAADVKSPGIEKFYGFDASKNLVNPRTIEVVKNGNIYAYPVPFKCETNDAILSFFTEGIIMDGSDASKMKADFSASAYVSAVMYEHNSRKQYQSLEDLIGIDYNEIERFTPNSVRFNSGIELLYTATYSKAVKIPNVLVRYMTNANNGDAIYGYDIRDVIDYEFYKVPYFSKIDEYSLKPTQTIALSGLTEPAVFYSYVERGGYYYFADYEYDNYSKKVTLAQNRKPIICVNQNDLSGKWVFAPEEQEYITDIADLVDVNNKHVVFLFGGTKNHGYIGYDNPMIVIIDVDNNQVLRYYGVPVKGVYYASVGLNKDSNVLILNRSDGTHEILDPSLFASKQLGRKTVLGITTGAINAIEADEKQWAVAKSADTKEAYQEYLRNYGKKRYEEDAMIRISEIEHEEAVAADNELWERIKNSNSISDFNSYLGRAKYKSHEKEAIKRKNLLIAQQTELSLDTAEQILDSYDFLSREYFFLIQDDDKTRYDKAKEFCTFNRIKRSSNNLTEALQFLSDYPNSEYRDEMSDITAKIMANNLTLASTNKEYKLALSYAVSKEAKQYVNNVIKRIKEKKKQFNIR